MQERFFNRELSWLEFNARVLFQGLNKELPLLERLQFLSIVTSNFDEFFQVRVAALKRLLAENPGFVDVSGLSPQMVYTSLSARAHQIIRSQQECLMQDILPELAHIEDTEARQRAQRQAAEIFFAHRPVFYDSSLSWSLHSLDIPNEGEGNTL